MHIDMTELRLGKQKQYLFVGIDRVCKYVSVELHERMTQAIAKAFLEHLIADCPFRFHTILTDSGAQFTYVLLAVHLRPKNTTHLFDQTCTHYGIQHRLTMFRHPWTNGQVEVFKQTIKAHTVKQYHDDTVDQLKHHLMAFLLVYNFQRPLRALNDQSPYARMVNIYQQPELFQYNTYQKIVGLKIHE